MLLGVFLYCVWDYRSQRLGACRAGNGSLGQ